MSATTSCQLALLAPHVIPILFSTTHHFPKISTDTPPSPPSHSLLGREHVGEEPQPGARPRVGEEVEASRISSVERERGWVGGGPSSANDVSLGSSSAGELELETGQG
jgi:hypothetical protein